VAVFRWFRGVVDGLVVAQVAFVSDRIGATWAGSSSDYNSPRLRALRRLNRKVNSSRCSRANDRVAVVQGAAEPALEQRETRWELSD
jgi:hypothetical protein